MASSLPCMKACGSQTSSRRLTIRALRLDSQQWNLNQRTSSAMGATLTMYASIILAATPTQGETLLLGLMPARALFITPTAATSASSALRSGPEDTFAIKERSLHTQETGSEAESLTSISFETSFSERREKISQKFRLTLQGRRDHPHASVKPQPKNSKMS